MPSTSFAGRRPRYIEQYARTVAAYQRFDDITRDIASEQDRINYLDSLLQNENANLTNLNEVFRVRPPDASGAMELLRQQYASEDASRRRASAGTARRAAGLSLPKAQADELEALLVNPTTRAPSSARDLAVSFITEDTTPEQVEDIIGILQAQGMDTSLIAQVQQQADSVARGTAASGAARALSPEEQAAEQAMQQQLEALFFAGPAGIRGGYDGQAIVERREKTAAPKGVGFSTEEEAFQAALAALADGAIVVEDFSTEEEFEYAKVSMMRQLQSRHTGTTSASTLRQKCWPVVSVWHSWRLRGQRHQAPSTQTPAANALPVSWWPVATSPTSTKGGTCSTKRAHTTMP